MKIKTLVALCLLSITGLTGCGQAVNPEVAAPMYAEDGTLIEPEPMYAEDGTLIEPVIEAEPMYAEDGTLVGTLAIEVEEIPIVLDNVSVSDTVLLSLQHYEGLKIAQSMRESAEYQLKRAKAGWGPSIDVSAHGGITANDGFYSDETGKRAGDFGSSTAFGASVVITQPLWNGFATLSRVKAGETSVAALVERVFDNATSVALDAVIVHVDLIRRRSIVLLAENNVKEHEDMLSSQRQRVSRGTAPTSDVTQTQGRLARARATLSQTIADREAAETQFFRMTGLDAPANMQEAVMPSILYADPEQLYVQSLLTNPKVKAYKLDIDTSNYNKDLSKSTFQPNVNLVVTPSYNFYDNPSDVPDSSSPFTSKEPDNNSTIGVDARLALTWNVFNMNADVNNVRSAEAQIRESEQVARNFDDELKREIDNTFYSYRAYGEQSSYYAEASKFNRLTRQAYGEQFRLGVRSLTDILDVESEYFSSATEELTSKGNVIVGAYRMVALSGELLPMLEIDPEEYMIGDHEIIPEIVIVVPASEELVDGTGMESEVPVDPNAIMIDPITGAPMIIDPLTGQPFGGSM